MSFLKDRRFRNAVWEALTVPTQLFFKTKWWGHKVEGLLVLITGASQGIGAALAKHLVAKGARVVLLARSLDKLNALKAEIERVHGQSKVWVYRCDCASPDEVDKTQALIRQDAGVPDVIVNNAGAGTWRYLAEVEGAELVRNLQTPALAAALVTRAFFADFVKRDSGAIVQILSPAALVGMPGATGYTMSRWALRGLSEALSADLYGTNVKVQNVMFSMVTSTYFDNNPGSIERMPPGAPVLSPEQAAQAIERAIRTGAKWSYAPFAVRSHFAWNAWAMREYVGVFGRKVRRGVFQGVPTHDTAPSSPPTPGRL